jgi:hypothetical protein
MRTLFCLPVIIALAVFWSCQKQQTAEERNAEIQRQVQQQLAAEHQTQEQQQLAQREAQLNEREKTLAEKEKATSAAAPARTPLRPITKSMRDSSGNNATASYSTFYTKLEPHGVWRETSTYGYVWQPREARESRSWRPYTNGHWVYTDAGWTWVSEEPFGWATYHYGRWTRLRDIGWVWVPGEEWAPAWVSWRKSNDYVGWAPLPPEAHFDRNSGIHNWADNYYDIGPDQYCFVPTNDLGAERVERVVVPAERNVTIVNQTINVTNITYTNTAIVNGGPNYDELRTRTAQPIPRLRLERQFNADINVENPRSIVRGEVIEVPAPVIARAQPVERPHTVTQTVSQAVVDHGWDAIADRQAADKVRTKIKAEATAPPNAPSRTFVKPAQAGAEVTTSPSTSAPGSAASSTIATEATPPSTATATPQPSVPIRSKRILDATPSVTPAYTPAATATAIAAPSAKESAITAPRATVTPRRLATPTPSASIAPEISATPSASPPASGSTSGSSIMGRSAESKDQREAAKELRKQERAAQEQQKKEEHEKARRAGETSAGAAAPVPPSTSTSASPSATASPFLSDKRELRKEEKKKQRREREGTAETSESVSPSPSPAPQ